MSKQYIHYGSDNFDIKLFEPITPEDLGLIIVASIFFIIATTFFILLACYIDRTNFQK